MSSRTRCTVFFIRGLSTYGVDRAKWSIFDFGPIARHFTRVFTAHEVDFIPVLDMGAGVLTDVAARAASFLENHPAFSRPEGVHIFGHSAGGLVARLALRSLDARARGKVRSLLTLASPNAGSALAQLCLDMPTLYPGSYRLLKAFGYDLKSNSEVFEDLTPSFVKRLALPDQIEGIATGSLVAWAPRETWCAPLRMFYRVKAFKEFELPSDGVVERDTQPFGDTVAEIKLDHFRQHGLFGGRDQFERMCAQAITYFIREQSR